MILNYLNQLILVGEEYSHRPVSTGSFESNDYGPTLIFLVEGPICSVP